jgi:hypothetical protein
MPERLVGSFPARFPDGWEEWIDIYETVNLIPTPVGPLPGPPGPRRLATRGGEQVERRDKVVYRIFPHGPTLRSDAPDAP